MASKPKKKYSELTPAYKKRLEAAYKSGKFGAGYSSAGRAYAAGASRQVARGQASEAARSQLRKYSPTAQKWANSHSASEATDYKPPTGSTPAERLEYTKKYIAMTKELEKGWKRRQDRGQVNWDIVKEFFDEYEPGGFDQYFPII